MVCSVEHTRCLRQVRSCLLFVAIVLLATNVPSPASQSLDLWIGIHLQYWSLPLFLPPRLLQCCRLRPELRRAYLHYCRIRHDSLHKPFVDLLLETIYKSTFLVLRQDLLLLSPFSAFLLEFDCELVVERMPRSPYNTVHCKDVEVSKIRSLSHFVPRLSLNCMHSKIKKSPTHTLQTPTVPTSLRRHASHTPNHLPPPALTLAILYSPTPVAPHKQLTPGSPPPQTLLPPPPPTHQSRSLICRHGPTYASALAA